MQMAKVTKSIGFIPMVEFVKTHPLIYTFEFKAGSSRRPIGVGSINPSSIVDKTEVGASLADGYVEEISTAHDQNRSWGGNFHEHDMFVSDKGGPLCVLITKEPNLDASDDNIKQDFRQLVSIFFNKYADDQNRRPPYLPDFVNRVEELTSGDDLERKVKRLVLRNHPFLVDSVKWRVLIEDFYTFYKTYKFDDLNARHAFIVEMSTYVCYRWHLNIVPKDAFLELVYWNGIEGRPSGYYTRDYSTDIHEEEDEDRGTYRYTSEDGYLAVFMRTFFVHGPDNALVCTF